MGSRYIPPELEQDREFIKSITPLDFTKNMGQYALHIVYTNGDIQVFTTESTNPNHFGTHEFESKQDMMTFYHDIKLFLSSH